MLFVLDATGTPSVARWVQLRAGAPDAPTLTRGRARHPGADRHPRARRRARPHGAADDRCARARSGANARTARLLIRADEPAALTVRVRIGRRTVRARMRLTRSRLNRTLVLRLRAGGAPAPGPDAPAHAARDRSRRRT